MSQFRQRIRVENAQLHVPCPSELSGPSLIASTELTEDMLMTRPGSWLVAPFFRRSANLWMRRVQLWDLRLIEHTFTLRSLEAKKMDEYITFLTSELRTIEDAFHVHGKHVIPTFLLWKIFKWTTPDNT